MLEDFQGALNWGPMMQRGASLSDSCEPERCRFSSPAWGVILICFNY